MPNMPIMPNMPNMPIMPPPPKNTNGGDPPAPGQRECNPLLPRCGTHRPHSCLSFELKPNVMCYFTTTFWPFTMYTPFVRCFKSPLTRTPCRL